LKLWNTEHGTRNAERETHTIIRDMEIAGPNRNEVYSLIEIVERVTQNTERETRNTERGTRNAKRGTFLKRELFSSTLHVHILRTLFLFHIGCFGFHVTKIITKGNSHHSSMEKCFGCLRETGTRSSGTVFIRI